MKIRSAPAAAATTAMAAPTSLAWVATELRVRQSIIERLAQASDERPVLGHEVDRQRLDVDVDAVGSDLFDQPEQFVDPRVLCLRFVVETTVLGRAEAGVDDLDAGTAFVCGADHRPADVAADPLQAGLVVEPAVPLMRDREQPERREVRGGDVVDDGAVHLPVRNEAIDLVLRYGQDGRLGTGSPVAARSFVGLAPDPVGTAMPQPTKSAASRRSDPARITTSARVSGLDRQHEEPAGGTPRLTRPRSRMTYCLASVSSETRLFGLGLLPQTALPCG